MIVAFTGHRPKKFKHPSALPWVRDRVRELLVELQPSKAISGMALGFDQLAAEVCVELGIPFWAAVPYPSQWLEWSWPAQQNYVTLLNKAERVHIVNLESPTSLWDAAAKLHNRNHWMVDNSDQVIAAWDGSDGGTQECVRYAEKIGRLVHRIQGWPVV